MTEGRRLPSYAEVSPTAPDAGAAKKPAQKPKHKAAAKRLKIEPTRPKSTAAKSKSPVKFEKKEKRVICKYWMEGKCAKGSDCTFSHDITPNKTVEEARQETVPCKYFMAGSCMKSAGTCLFSHDLSRVPCKFLHGLGECAAGEACRYSHAPVNDEARAEIILQMRRPVSLATDRSASPVLAAPKPAASFVPHAGLKIPRIPTFSDSDEQ